MKCCVKTDFLYMFKGLFYSTGSHNYITQSAVATHFFFGLTMDKFTS